MGKVPTGDLDEAWVQLSTVPSVPGWNLGEAQATLPNLYDMHLSQTAHLQNGRSEYADVVKTPD